MARNTISIENEVEKFLRERLAERIEKLTENEYVKWLWLYPGGDVREDQLISCIDLCDRTIRKNGAENNA